MTNQYLLIGLLSFISISNAIAQIQNEAVDSLLANYAESGAKPDSQQGKQLWQKNYAATGIFNQRSCASCHTKDLTQSGKHIKTQKVIKPMSTEININRLTDIKKIEKWFKRNCKWTMGRECSVQEKASILTFLTHPVSN